MAAFYQTFTSARTTVPDPKALLDALRAAVSPDVGPQPPVGNTLTVKKSTAWTAPQIVAAQTVIDAAPASSPQLGAQAEIDAWPISLKALVLALIDQLNVIRAGLPTPLPPITPAAALTAIRQKAGTL